MAKFKVELMEQAVRFATIEIEAEDIIEATEEAWSQYEVNGGDFSWDHWVVGNCDIESYEIGEDSDG